MNRSRRLLTNRGLVLVIVLTVLGGVRPQASASRPKWTAGALSLDIGQVPRSQGRNDSKASYDHALDLEKGRGVTRNVAEAISWYRKAAALGNVDAVLRLGILYQNGTIEPRDYREAVLWCRRAAELGSPSGMFYLGTLYWSGRGVEQDLTEAYKWLNLAAMHAPAKDQPSLALTRDSLGRVLSVERIAEAKRRGQEWEVAFKARK